MQIIVLFGHRNRARQARCHVADLASFSLILFSLLCFQPLTFHNISQHFMLQPGFNLVQIDFSLVLCWPTSIVIQEPKHIPEVVTGAYRWAQYQDLTVVTQGGAIPPTCNIGAKYSSINSDIRAQKRARGNPVAHVSSKMGASVFHRSYMVENSLSESDTCISGFKIWCLGLEKGYSRFRIGYNPSTRRMALLNSEQGVI